MVKEFTQDQRSRMTENAKNMFSFTTGQKVGWLNGSYDYYFVVSGYRENEIKFYDLINPIGGNTPRVREDELLAD